MLCPPPLVPSLILSRQGRRVFGSRWRTLGLCVVSPTSGAEPYIVPAGEASVWLQVENTQHALRVSVQAPPHAPDAAQNNIPWIRYLTKSQRILENKLSIRKTRKYSGVTASVGCLGSGSVLGMRIRIMKID